jgi:hypothetical protein
MKFWILGWLMAISGFSFARHNASDGPAPASGKPNSMLEFFRNGKPSGHMRYYFMGTDNRASLTDYFANAIGGGLKFETDTFLNFQLGLSGFYIFNIGSSDLTKKDPKTGGLSRYESGQFDIRDLNNRHDLDRLEELYLKYSLGKTTLVFGRQIIKSPFINPQDGRMRPTAESGLWMESVGDLKNWEFRLGYLFEISPRGTLEWFQIGESVGLYGAGVDETGSRSRYPGKLESKAVVLGNLTYQSSPSLKIQYWSLAAHNLFHTQWVQADGQLAKGWFWGFQGMAQGRLGEGGNATPELAFVSERWKAYADAPGMGTGALLYVHVAGTKRRSRRRACRSGPGKPGFSKIPAAARTVGWILQITRSGSSPAEQVWHAFVRTNQPRSEARIRRGGPGPGGRTAGSV